MITYKQHVPAFINDGAGGEVFKCNKLEELLDHLKEWLEHKEYNLVFAYADHNTIMISATNTDWWWVLGYVEGIKLKKHLPYYEHCHLFKVEDKIKIVSFADESRSGLFAITSTLGDECSLCCLESGHSFAWTPLSKLNFVRYADKEDIDLLNGYKLREE